MPEYVPTSALVGMPEIFPVAGSSVAQAGKFIAVKVNESPFGSVAVGWNVYRWLGIAVAAGLPWIDGLPDEPVGALPPDDPPPPHAARSSTKANAMTRCWSALTSNWSPSLRRRTLSPMFVPHTTRTYQTRTYCRSASWISCFLSHSRDRKIRAHVGSSASRWSVKEHACPWFETGLTENSHYESQARWELSVWPLRVDRGPLTVDGHG